MNPGIKESYINQVQLLIRILPYVALEEDLALKGGTAINMFIWDMYRLSVDLDLCYIKFDERREALENISKIIARIKQKLANSIPGIRLESKGAGGDFEEKLICYLKDVQVKIEINTMMRGIIAPVTIRPIAKSAQNQFGLFSEMQIISEGEIFGGKICAALDRQHPRDLFDIYYLLSGTGISQAIKNGFIMALLSHSRPIHEMFRPNFHDQENSFKTQFNGMNFQKFSYKDFEETRKKLVTIINEIANQEDREFLLSFKSGQPNWDLIKIEQLQNLPAVKWKLMNIQKLATNNPTKHLKLVKALENVLF